MQNWSKDHPQINEFIKSFLKNTAYQITGLAGDASNRKYFRVLVNEGQQSYVLMAWEPFKASDYPFLSVLAHFKKHSIHVPEVILYDENLGLVLLEDLGDYTLETQFWTSKKPDGYIPFYELALDELLKIHYDATKDKTAKCKAFDYSFDVEKFNWELQFTKTHLFDGILKIPYSESVQKNIDLIFINISERLHAQPKFIQHRDYHSRNIMIKDKEVKVIDFQDARLGPIQYDLVSLFKDAYVEFPPVLERKFLISYFEESKKYTSSLKSMEEFIKIYELQTIQRCLKAAGSFASFYMLRDDTRYLQYLKGTLDKAKDALMIFPEYKELLKVMTDAKAFSTNYKELPVLAADAQSNKALSK